MGATIVCWSCGLQGHSKKECAVATQRAQEREDAAASKKVVRTVAVERSPVELTSLVCWHCGEKGHTRQNCTRTGLADCRPVAKVMTKKAAAKKVAIVKQEPADDARSDSTVATASDKNVPLVREKDRIAYEQWKEKEEARRAKKLGRLPLSEALRIVNDRNTRCATAQAAKVDDAEYTKDIPRQQRQVSQSVRKATKRTSLPLCEALQVLKARDVLCVAVKDASVEDVESVEEAEHSEDAKVEEEEMEEPSELSQDCDVLCVAVKDALVEDVESDEEVDNSEDAKVEEEEDKEEPSEQNSEYIWEFVD